MAKKPSPAELKAQGEELSKQIAELRKKELNFAMVMGADGIVFHTDRKKNCEVLWRNAKKEAGGAKGAKGIVSVSGKTMILDADDPSSVPGPLLKVAKKHFAERGLPIRVVLKGEEDAADEEDADETEATELSGRPADSATETDTAPSGDAPTDETGPEDRTEILRKSLLQDFKTIKPDLELASQSPDPDLKKKLEDMARAFAQHIETDVPKAHAVMGLMQTTIASAKEKGELGTAQGDAPVKKRASGTRRKKLAALQKGVDQLLERLS